MAINSNGTDNGSAVRIDGPVNGVIGVNGTNKSLLDEDRACDPIPFDISIAKGTSRELKTEILLLAWALLLHRYSRSNDIDFSWGYDQAPDSEDDVPSPKMAERLSLEPGQPVSAVLEVIRLVRTRAEFPSIGKEHRDGCHLVLDDGSHSASQNGHSHSSNWNLQFHLSQCDEQLLLRPEWRSEIEKSTAMSYAFSFMEIARSLFRNQDQTVSQSVGVNEQELEKLWQWNGDLPPTIDQCMHDIIMEQCRIRSDSIAVDSWDGKMTYGELNQRSNQLAGDLLAVGVELGIIPLCFEKSMWTVVGVMAVMKAGAAFALMDPSQPEARLRTIVSQVNAKVVLTSKSQHSLASRLSDEAKVITVDWHTFDNQPRDEMALPSVPSSSRMYVQFTSGSTGQPKGVLISHTNYTSGALPRAEIVGYRSHSRVLDFASYAFDVSIDCMLCTLARGGCVCVPSDEQRVNDLGGTIRDLKVNMAHMTRSVARVLDLDTIAYLDVLGLGGETVTAGDAAVWTQLTRIVIAYGPSECTVGSNVNGKVVPTGKNPTIGKGVGAVCWIVDPTDHTRLMPPGAVGELLIEGPIVGQGYLNDPEKTSAVFISDPAWLRAGSASVLGRHGRLYKTGDLVKYDTDGSIIFIGRKDTQVKLRGQRVELSEVEYHLRLDLPSWAEVAAEVVVPKAEGAKPALVAFVSGTPQENRHIQKAVTGTSNGESVTPTFHMQLVEALARIDEALGKTLPVYMVPSAYVPIQKMPMMVSGKLDRKRLREIGASMSPRELAALRTAHSATRAPETEMERTLQNIWSRLFSVEESDITADDNFFGLGGDSILVMRLVAAARGEGLTLTVQDAFSHPKLFEMATVVTKSVFNLDSDIPAFSLLDPAWAKVASIEAAKLCGVEPSSIQDIFPCTPLQEGLMALSAKHTEAYVAQRVVDIPDQAAEDALRAAWEATVAGCSVLRTRIISVQGQGLMQVIIDEGIDWTSGSVLDDYLENDKRATMQLGSQLARYGIITNPKTSKRQFVWTIHHALYDGWSMPLVMERVKRSYQGLKTIRAVEFKSFIKYLHSMDLEASKSFWNSQLIGANGPQFPALPSPGYEPSANSLLERRVPLTRNKGSNTTVSTIIRAAWAIVTAHLTGRDDVVFGETLIGRSVPVTGVDEIEGPMITTVPVRIRINRSTSIQEFLQNLNSEAVLRIPHEHFGLQHIRRLSPDARVACDLRTGLVIQPSQVGDSSDEVLGGGLAPASDHEAAREALKFNSYGLMLVFSLETDGFLIMASFDSNMVDVPKMERVLEQLDNTVQRLAQEGNTLIERLQGLNLDQQPPSQLPLTNTVTVRAVTNGIASQKPESTVERKLQQLWASTIGLGEEEIRTSDHFFRLGGDSISAMKLVSAIKLEGFSLTVANVFRNPLLSDMARLLEKANPPQPKKTISHAPYSSLDLLNIFLSEAIRPSLADPTWKIKDVLSTTALQEGAVNATIAAPRFSVQYNLLYLDPSINQSLLFGNLQQLIAHHDILRTVYVKYAGRCLQVVLEALDLPVMRYETNRDLEGFVEGLCTADADADMPLGSSFLKFMFITGKGSNKQNCLVMRMSHAQYDGICLPDLILQLKALYEGVVVLPAPQYSSYINYLTHENVSESRQHWRTLLQGSSMTQIHPRSTQSSTAIAVSQEVNISSRPKEITPATFLTAGWAIVLSRFLSINDVTFGQVVSGRLVDIPECEKIQGPCDNHNAVRIKLQRGWTYLDLLHHVQDQHVANAPFENTQLRDIIKYCTAWPENTEFDSVVHHQDIEYFDDMELGGTNCRLDALNPHGEPAQEWKVQSYLKDGILHLEIVSSDSWRELAEKLLQMLRGVVGDMAREPTAAIF